MASQGTPPPIGGRYEVELASPLHGAAGGLEAYAATDQSSAHRFMAVRVRDGDVLRGAAVRALSRVSTPGLVAPLDHGLALDSAGRLARFVICDLPPGPSLASAMPGRRWSEAELVGSVLRPAAASLAVMHARGITHRAVRPDNVFQATRGDPVVLGCAWASLPASRQPPVYEPPYSAICLPHGRGDGAPADDIYALGVLLVALSAGAQPMSGLDPALVTARKLDAGSFAAVTEGVRLAPGIADLVRAMLAEDPDHRPTAALLADPGAARSRPVASRPRRRAQRAIELAGCTIWDARSLAHVLATRPDIGIPALRNGSIYAWLRRALGDEAMTLAVDEAVRWRVDQGAGDSELDAAMLMRALPVLDPLAPVCWNGIAFWPDALGPVLTYAAPEQTGPLSRFVEMEAVAAWAEARPDRVDVARLRAEANLHRRLLKIKGWAGGLARLCYTTTPLLPCRSSRLRADHVGDLAGVLPALERLAGEPDRPALPLDQELGSFIAALAEFRMDKEFAVMARADADPETVAVAQLRVLAAVQERSQVAPTPGLAEWLAGPCRTVLDETRSRTRQAEARQALERAIAKGGLRGVLDTLDNPAMWARDEEDAATAASVLAGLDADIAATTRDLALARAASRPEGHEIAAACGTIACAVAAISALF